MTWTGTPRTMWRWNAVLAAEQGAGDSGEADLEARERRGACTRPGIRTTDGGWAASEGGVDEGEGLARLTEAAWAEGRDMAESGG